MTEDPEQRGELVALCAQKYDISVERVRQIYRGALADIRASLEQDGYHHSGALG